jgi:hypothetical protein
MQLHDYNQWSCGSLLYCFSKTLSYFVFDKIHFINSFSPSSVLTALNLGDKIVPTMNAAESKIG